MGSSTKKHKSEKKKKRSRSPERTKEKHRHHKKHHKDRKRKIEVIETEDLVSSSSGSDGRFNFLLLAIGPETYLNSGKFVPF